MINISGERKGRYLAHEYIQQDKKMPHSLIDQDRLLKNTALDEMH